MKEVEINKKFNRRVVKTMNEQSILDESEKKKSIAKQCRNFQAVSFSGEFFCMESNGSLGIYRTPAHVGAMVTTLAIIKNRELIGISGNNGNRFDKLSDIEKVDCATIVVRLQNEGII